MTDITTPCIPEIVSNSGSAITVSGQTAPKVGILCGGQSTDRHGPLVSGQATASALADTGYRTDMMDLDRLDLTSLRARTGVAFLGLHGLGGEDGKIQGMLETLRIPYTGSGVLASALGMFKPGFKALLTSANIDTPQHVMLYPGLLGVSL